MQRIALGLALTALVISPGCGGGASRESEDQEKAWRGSNWAESNPHLFGVEAALDRPADASDYRPRRQAEADERVLLAEGLKADFVSRDLAGPADMMVLYPDAAKPTHALVCIEQPRNGVTPGGNDGMNPGVQRVELRTGKVETILHGTNHCDGIRMTPWGTVLATEETLDGRAYELIEPIATTGHWIADRDSGDVRNAVDGDQRSTHVVQRRHLPMMAWEGLAVLPSGVIYAGDELRPGDAGRDRDGGAIYKFLPAAPRQGNALVSRLEDSPLVAGSNYALTVS
ncbi:MAG: hypothetical protein PVG38_17510, partial [Gammaproteobacteria bacterium]